MRPSLCPASNCSMRSFTLAAMTSLAVCALGVLGMVAMLLVSFVVAMLAGCCSWVVPPFLNGCAVFAHKHALALAHASEGRQVQGEDSFPGVQRRASAAKVCTSAARKIKAPLARARSGAPQEGLVSLLGAKRKRLLLVLALRVGVAGRNRPVEVGSEDAKAAGEGRRLPPLKEQGNLEICGRF